jgi:hypothetical protein
MVVEVFNLLCEFCAPVFNRVVGEVTEQDEFETEPEQVSADA